MSNALLSGWWVVFWGDRTLVGLPKKTASGHRYLEPAYQLDRWAGLITKVVRGDTIGGELAPIVGVGSISGIASLKKFPLPEQNCWTHTPMEELSSEDQNWFAKQIEGAGKGPSSIILPH